MLIKAEREKILKLKRKHDGCVRNERKDTTESEEFNDIETMNNCGHEVNENIQLNQMKKILWNLSRNHLEINDWKKLARFWDFTEEQIKGILLTVMNNKIKINVVII